MKLNLRTIVASFVVALATSASAQTQTYKVSGMVMNSNGKAVELATVILNNDLVTSTVAGGRFVLRNVPKGKYTYKVTFVGYQTVTDTITVDADRTINVTLNELGLQLHNVVVTARQVQMGSKSLVGEDAIRHIQPKSVSDILQLVPGNLTENPNLNKLSQAHIREIDNDDKNNALGTGVVVDGTPLSNNANLQALAPTRYGSNSGAQSDGMSDQTTAGQGVDLRTVSAGNIESVEVVRGIPGVEYGNLTSGLVIVKTKSGRTPWEVKAQTDPYSKLVYAGKGFALSSGGAMNFSVDWSQSWGDTRRHYLGYDRMTATAGYSNRWGGLSFNVKGAVYSNINNRKQDPQYKEQDLHFKNKNIGARLSLNGSYASSKSFITRIDYNLSAQMSKTSDEHYNLISNPDGVITDVREPGIHEATFKNKSYHSEYRIDGMPINIYAQVVANKYVGLGGNNHTTIKIGAEYTYDANKGDGLTFDMANPPQAMGAQRLRPRAFKSIPALNTLSGFLSDKLSLSVGTTRAAIEAGLRISNLFLNANKSGGNSGMLVAEPRVNTTVSLLNKRNNSFIDDLSLTGGFGLSNKMPTLLYLYPDNVYYDNVSLSKYGDNAKDRLALLTTDVISNTTNPSLRPAHSRKWEAGLSFRKGQVRGFITYFNERHTHEFGFSSQLYWANYTQFHVPSSATDPIFDASTGNVTYTYNNERLTAQKTLKTDMLTWYRPSNNSRSLKHGIEYGLDFGTFKPLRTSLSINGAWFHIARTEEGTSLNYINRNFNYVAVMPSGFGTVKDRFNTTFRFITHLPAVKMIFTTTVQVVWYDSERMVYNDASGNARTRTFNYQGRDYLAVDPMGYYDRTGKYTEWQHQMADDATLGLMMLRYQTYAFKRDVVKPWALLNFRFTKEIGSIAELSFTANNFTNTHKWHTNKHTLAKRQLYPEMYFGAELKLKL